MTPLRALLQISLFAFVFGKWDYAFARTIKPCLPGESAQISALDELKAIDVAVRSLAPDVHPEALIARIEAMVNTKCFEILGGISLGAADGLSLKTYWESGGFARLRDTLHLGERVHRMMRTEPSVRRSLTVETAPTSPIIGMLCSATDENCGAETAAWELRANQIFTLEETTNTRSHESIDCAAAARAVPPRRRFKVWRECFEGSRADMWSVGRTSLPIGSTRAPKQGWLVIKGRRGHYSFCDKVGAYDLATGSAYVLSSCSALALEASGAVNAKATNDARQNQVKIGHLSIDHLREAVWMMVLLDELDSDVRVVSVGKELPEWIQARVDSESEDRGGRIEGGVGVSTDQTRLVWEIVGGDHLQKSGRLTYPYSMQVAEDHAVHLLRIAEMKFEQGCPEVTMPVSLMKLSSGSGDAFKSLWEQASAQQATCRAKK